MIKQNPKQRKRHGNRGNDRKKQRKTVNFNGIPHSLMKLRGAKRI